MRRGALLLGSALLLSAATTAADALADGASSSDGSGLTTAGQIVTGLAAGTLSAALTPIIVRALPRIGDQQADASGRFPVSFAALGLAAIGGGATLAIGIAMWKRGERERAKAAADSSSAKAERRSPAARAVGVSLTITGLSLAGATVVFTHDPGSCNDSRPPDCEYPWRTAAVGTAIGAGVTLVAGIPLWVYGAHRVPAANRAFTAPSVLISPTGGSLRWSF